MESEYVKSTLNEMLERLDKNRYVNSEKTIEFGLEVYSLCKEKNYETGMALALLFIGQAYGNTSKYEKATQYLFDSMNLSQSQNICDLQVLAHINLGNIYFDIGEYERSLDYYNSAEKLAKIITLSKNYYTYSSFEFYTAKIYNNIGEIYRILKYYEDAIIYYNLAVNLDKKLNYQANFGIELTNLSYIEYHQGNYDKAVEYLNESLVHLKNNDYKIGIAEAYGIFALIHEKKANHEECEKYFSKAIDFSTETNYFYVKIDVLLDYCSYLESVGKRAIAIQKLNEAYTISIDNKIYAKTMDICKRAIKLYEGTNDINSANKYYKLYFENGKKRENIEFENRARILKTKVQLDSLEKENKSILEKSEAFRKKSEDLIEIIKKISIISELGEKITTTLSLNEIYEMLYDTVQIFMQANNFGVGLYNDGEKKIQYHYIRENNNRSEIFEIDMDDKASIAVKCLEEKKIIVINDMVNEYLNYVDDVNYITDNKDDGEEVNSAIYCPLIIDNNLIGVMTIQTYEKSSFTMLKIEMIKALSSYAAIAINNAMKSMNLLVEVEQRRELQTQLEEINNKLIYLSENDGLTGIPNRRKFDNVITEEWNKAKEKKGVISIIIFDIDCFKQYNDHYGHTDGDNCLISIGNALNKVLIRNYFAARYGGDEFVIVLPDTNLEEAMTYGENFRRIVEELALPHKFSKVREVVTVTLGVSSIIPNDGIRIIEFIRQADNALYEAKNNGKNKVYHY